MRKEFNRLMTALFILLIGFPFFAFTLASCGGGGGGSDPAPTSHAPTISNLQYSPHTATQNQSEASVSVTGTINFMDQGGDITTLIIKMYNANNQVLSTDTFPVPNVSGVTSGTISLTVSIDTSNIANYTFKVYVTDRAGSDSNMLSGTFSVTAPVPPPPSPSDALIGNFRFVYKIISTNPSYTDRITLNEKSDQISSEGTYLYTGYDADYPSVTAAAGAWMPSISKYVVASVIVNTSFAQGYIFSINSDNTLPGCWMISSDSGKTWSNCYSFILPASHKTPLGSWEMSMESQNKPQDINEIDQQKFNETQEAEAQRSESESSQNSNLVSKINELKAIIERKH